MVPEGGGGVHSQWAPEGGRGRGAFTGGHQGVISTVLRAPTRATIPYRIYYMSGRVLGSRDVYSTRQNVIFTLRPYPHVLNPTAHETCGTLTV